MSSTAERCDLLVAGGGLAGLLSGVLLARAGFEVRICERAREARDDPRSIALSESSRKVLETAGLWDAVAACSVPVAHVDVSQQGCFGSTRLHASEEGLAAFGHVVQARDLLSILRAEAVSSCDLRTGMEVRATHPEDCAVRVTCAGDQGEQSVSARLLVVADGRDSGLREALGIGVVEQDRGHAALVARLALSRADDDWAFERFTPAGPLALLPHPQGGRTVVWAQERGPCRALSGYGVDRLRAEIARALGPRVGDVTEVGKPAVFDLVFRRAHVRTGVRSVLIGDAAYSFHPVAAQGFNLVVRDVAWLAQECARTREHGGDCGDAEVLRAYAGARDTDARRVAWFTDLLDIGFRGRSPLLRGLRGGLLFGLDCLPALRTSLVRFGMGVDLPQSELARGVPRG